METAPPTHISEQTEMASTRVAYARFHSQLQTAVDSFSTYATELVNWSERDVRITLEEVLEGMKILTKDIDKEEDKRTWEEMIHKSENLLRWLDYDIYQISFATTDHGVDAENVPFYHLFSIPTIYLHVSNDHGVIAVPNCFSKTLRSLNLPEIASQLEALNPGYQITRDAITLMWYTLTHSLFRFEKRSMRQKYFLAGLAKLHYAEVTVRTIQAMKIIGFVIPPVEGSSFGHVILFMVRLLYMNPFLVFARHQMKKAWALAAFHYGMIPDLTGATDLADSIFLTHRMSLYFESVARRKTARLVHEGKTTSTTTCLEDLCFHVDENLVQIPWATFPCYETMSVFVEWATQYSKDNLALQPTKQKIIDDFRRYVKASDSFKDKELADEEVATFWEKNPWLCAPVASNSDEPQTQLSIDHRQIQNVTDPFAIVAGQTANVDGQNADLVNQLADVNGQLADATAQLSDLTNQNTALNEQVTSLQAQIAELMQRQVVPQADLDRVMAEAWQVVRDRDTVTNERDFLRNILQQIHSHYENSVLALQNVFNSMRHGNGNGRQ